MSNGAISNFSIGGILARGVQVLGRNLVPFGTLSGLFMLPPFVIGLMIGSGNQSPITEPKIGMVALIALWILLYFLLFATLTHATIRDLRGTPGRIGESLSWGLGRLFPVIGITIVASLGAGLGIVLFIVPGLMLMTMWWVAVPAAVIERTGVLGGLRRSAELTRGYRWRVFGIVVIIYIGQFVFDLLTSRVLASAPYFSLFANFMITLAVTAYFAVVTAVCYHDLRILKEGVNVDDIAKVFD